MLWPADTKATTLFSRDNFQNKEMPASADPLPETPHLWELEDNNAILTAVKAKYPDFVDHYCVLKESKLQLLLLFAVRLHTLHTSLSAQTPPLQLPESVGTGVMDLAVKLIAMLSNGDASEAVLEALTGDLRALTAPPRPPTPSMSSSDSSTSVTAGATPAGGAVPDNEQFEEEPEPQWTDTDREACYEAVLDEIEDVLATADLRRHCWAAEDVTPTPATARLPPPIAPVGLRTIPPLSAAAESTELGALVGDVAKDVLDETRRSIVETIAQAMVAAKSEVKSEAG